jgi:hypothetical protein
VAAEQEQSLELRLLEQQTPAVVAVGRLTVLVALAVRELSMSATGLRKLH